MHHVSSLPFSLILLKRLTVYFPPSIALLSPLDSSLSSTHSIHGTLSLPRPTPIRSRSLCFTPYPPRHHPPSIRYSPLPCRNFPRRNPNRPRRRYPAVCHLQPRLGPRSPRHQSCGRRIFDGQRVGRYRPRSVRLDGQLCPLVAAAGACEAEGAGGGGSWPRGVRTQWRLPKAGPRILV